MDIPKEEEHEECDLILDITYVEECDHATTTHCEEEFTQVHNTSDYSPVVHHDSHHGTKCHDKKDKECHKIPKEDIHEECKTIVNTVIVEECEEIPHARCDCGFLPLHVCHKHL